MEVIRSVVTPSADYNLFAGRKEDGAEVEGDELETVFAVEFPEQGADMGLNGADAHFEDEGDFGVLFSGFDPLEDFAFAAGELENFGSECGEVAGVIGLADALADAFQAVHEGGMFENGTGQMEKGLELVACGGGERGAVGGVGENEALDAGQDVDLFAEACGGGGWLCGGELAGFGGLSGAEEDAAGRAAGLVLNQGDMQHGNTAEAPAPVLQDFKIAGKGFAPEK